MLGDPALAEMSAVKWLIHMRSAVEKVAVGHDQRIQILARQGPTRLSGSNLLLSYALPPRGIWAKYADLSGKLRNGFGGTRTPITGQLLGQTRPGRSSASGTTYSKARCGSPGTT